MKIMRKDKFIQFYEEIMFSEANIHKELDHPNIAKLHELFEDTNYYYLITEYE